MERRGGPIRLLLIGLLALSVNACGGEREFTPRGFVDAMNAEGAALALGPVLTTNPDGVDVYTVAFTDLAPSATGEGEVAAESQGSATLLVVADADAAREEYARCEQAPALTCFRAANTVLRAEELPASDQARISTALEAMQTTDG